MAHPAHYYIKYLLLSQDDSSKKAVDATLRATGLASISEETLKGIRASIEVPENFRAWDKTDKLSVQWLRQERIYSLFHPDTVVQDVCANVLANPRLRTDVETLIIGNVAPRDAAMRMQKLKKPVGEQAFSEFRHYYWNPEVMGLTDWVDYLSKDDTRRTRAIQSDLVAALKCGQNFALYKVGVTTEVDSKEVLREIQRELYFTFQEVKALPVDAKKVEMLGHLARGMSRVDERLAAGDAALTEVLRKFNKFKVATKKDEIPSLFDLAPSGSISNKSRNEILTTRDKE